MQTQAFLKAVSSVGVFLLLAIPGFVFTRKKLLTGRQVEGISSVLVNFLWPAMVVDAMAKVQASRELLRQAGQSALWALMVIVLGALCAWIWLKVDKIGSVPGGILLFAAAFANTGLIGMPLIRLLLGEEMLFLASIVELVNDVLIFSVGILLIQTGCGKPRQAAVRGLLSPGLVGVAVGFVLFLTGWKLPAFVGEALSMAAEATAPMVLFLVGAQLGEGDLKALIRDAKAWVLTGLRLVVIPAAVLVLWRICLGELTPVGRTLLLLSAMPGGACCAMFTRQYGGDWGLATRCVMLSTLCAVATVPLWLLVTIL